MVCRLIPASWDCTLGLGRSRAHEQIQIVGKHEQAVTLESSDLLEYAKRFNAPRKTPDIAGHIIESSQVGTILYGLGAVEVLRPERIPRLTLRAVTLKVYYTSGPMSWRGSLQKTIVPAGIALWFFRKVLTNPLFLP